MAQKDKNSSQSGTPTRKKRKTEKKPDGATLAFTDLENLMDAAKLGALFLDRELRARQFTANAQRLLNISSADQGRPIARLKRRLGYSQIVEDASQVLHSLIPVERQVSKNRKWFLVRITPDCAKGDEINGVTVTFIDITALKQSAQVEQEFDETLEERVVQRWERKVRQLVGLLSEAEQRERHRISQLLHDDLQQRLYAVKAKLSMVADMIKQQNWDGLETLVADLEQSLAESISITRNLSVDFSPLIPEGKLLSDSLAMLATQMQRHYSLDVALKTESFENNIDDSLQALLLQVVRELLFNIVKHAGTSRATVTLEQVGDQIRITVSDEGKGFDPVAVSMASGNAHGLFSMRPRLGLIGGQMEITSMPGTGTQVVIHTVQTAAKSGGERIEWL